MMKDSTILKNIFSAFYGTDILKQEFMELIDDDEAVFLEPRLGEDNKLMIDIHLDWSGGFDTARTIDLNDVILSHVEYMVDEDAWGEERAAKNKKDAVNFADMLIKAAEKIKEMAAE